MQRSETDGSIFFGTKKYLEVIPCSPTIASITQEITIRNSIFDVVEIK